MPNKLPISVCLISGAEAHRIGRALASVAEWTSEIIVVLNEEVSDGTDQIAKQFGAKIFREPWKGFIGQKNSALEKATQPWVLGLDADEEVSPALRDEMQRALVREDLSPAHAAYEFPRCTFYCDRWIRHGDWYPDRVTRLWKRATARWKGMEPHAALALDGSTGRLHADLLHFSNESIDRQIAKIGPYSDYFVQHCLAQQRNIHLFDFAIRPVWKFLRAYFFRLGFLDGWPGYYIAWMSAFSSVTRCAKVKEAQSLKVSA